MDKRSETSALNGQKGGVKTPEGKRISSKNSTKHGIFSEPNVPLDRIGVEEVYEIYAAEFGDEPASRKFLIYELSVLHLRLLRCLRFENEYIRNQLNPPRYEKKLVKGIDFELGLDPEFETVTVHEGEPMTFDPKNLEGLENVYVKYETQFFNRYSRIIELLTQSNN